MATLEEQRRAILSHLDASRPFLLACTPEEIAIELVVQGLDIVRPDQRAAVIAAAQRELDEEA